MVDHTADNHDWETCSVCLEQAVADGILASARGVGGESAGTRIEKLRQIVDNHEAGLVDGYWVDAQTANMLVTVYDALRVENQAKFETVGFLRLVDFGWKHVTVKGGS